MPVIPHYLRQRPPNADDDRLQLVFKDSTWLDESANRLYRSDEDTPHNAVWTDITPPSGGPGGSVSWNDVLNKPSTFTPTTPIAQSSISDLVSALSSKVETNDSRLSDARTPLAHPHVIADTTGLQTALNGRESLSQKGIANGYASLGADGLVPASQLPVSGGGGAWTTVKKTADESHNSSAVVADDNTLIVPLLANTQYAIRLMAFFLTNATADLKYRLVFTGATTRVRRRVRRTATTDIAQTIALLTAFDAADVILSTTGLNPWLQEDIILQVGASGGNLVLRWGQVVSNAGPTTCLEGSYLEHMLA